MTRLGLIMIVRDEASVVERALDSALCIVDYVLVSDTGSTDGTPDVVRSWLQRNEVAGDVIERPWVNFSYNRNEVIERLRRLPSIDYALSIDADDFLEFDQGFDPHEFKNSLTAADAWSLVNRVERGKFTRLQIFSNHQPFRYRHRMHEQLVLPEGSRRAAAHGVSYRYTYEGARQRNPNKYLDDARVMEEEFAAGGYDDPATRPRGMYFLAQCYRDAKLYAKARDTYLARTTMGGSRDEISWSFYNAALSMHLLGEPADQVIATHLMASEFGPDRAEPLWAAARIANLNGLHQQAYRLAATAADRREPEASPIDTVPYEWGALDELLVACIGTGRFSEAVEVAERLLSEAKFPESERQRIEQNAAYALAQYELAPVIGPNAKSALAN